LKDININVSNNEFDFYEIYKPDFDLFSKKLTHVGILFFYLKKKVKNKLYTGKKNVINLILFILVENWINQKVLMKFLFCYLILLILVII
jgi:hypothetical protein